MSVKVSSTVLSRLLEETERTNDLLSSLLCKVSSLLDSMDRMNELLVYKEWDWQPRAVEKKSKKGVENKK